MTETCVAHLVRRQNGTEPFEAFIESFKAHPAGIAHDLLLVFKGFDEERVPAEHERIASGLDYTPFFVPDEGFDIGSYFAIARAHRQYRYFCFLNSYSVILDTGWLAEMHRHISRESVGLVGASGSWESHYTNQLALYREWKHKSNLSLRNLFEGRARRRELRWWRANFDTFPNYHLRTNAFLLRRDLMLRLEGGAFADKKGGYLFESGKRSMTRQVLGMNLSVLVVGRDAVAYEKERWFESRTFRNGGQSNLLVADNRTREYTEADAALKKAVRAATWGELALKVPEID